MQVPAGFRATGDCDRMSPLDKCTFTLLSDSNKIVYLIESGIIKSKTFKLSSKTNGPFSLSALDTTSSTKNKVQKATGAILKLYNDPEVYLQSNEMKCEGNSYTISVYFNSRRRAQEVIVSSLPPI